MNKKDDYILILTAVLLLILVGGTVRFFGAGEYKSNQDQASKIIGMASLTIEFAGNNIRGFEGGIIEKETSLDALIQASKAGNFSYDDFIKNNNRSWYWYLNGKKIDKPLNEIILKPGDKILIKHE